MITKNTIRRGIQEHSISFIVDPNMGSGTVCKIGDSWFCFGGLTAEEMSPDEYLKNVPTEDIVNEIYDVLSSFSKNEDFIDEYNYYDAILTYKNGIVNGGNEN